MMLIGRHFWIGGSTFLLQKNFRKTLIMEMEHIYNLIMKMNIFATCENLCKTLLSPELLSTFNSEVRETLATIKISFGHGSFSFCPLVNASGLRQNILEGVLTCNSCDEQQKLNGTLALGTLKFYLARWKSSIVAIRIARAPIKFINSEEHLKKSRTQQSHVGNQESLNQQTEPIAGTELLTLNNIEKTPGSRTDTQLAMNDWKLRERGEKNQSITSVSEISQIHSTAGFRSDHINLQRNWLCDLTRLPRQKSNNFYTRPLGYASSIKLHGNSTTPNGHRLNYSMTKKEKLSMCWRYRNRIGPPVPQRLPESVQ